MSKTLELAIPVEDLPKNKKFLCAMDERGDAVASSRRSTEPLKASSISKSVACGTIVSRMELSTNSWLLLGGTSSAMKLTANVEGERREVDWPYLPRLERLI